MTRIVYIEDDASSRSMMYMILSRSGYEFVGAANGQDGIEQVITQQPDLVLLDINLPDLDGMQILKIIREDPRTESIPVIAVTARALDSGRNDLVAQGFDAYIPKPISRPHLLETIARIIEG